MQGSGSVLRCVCNNRFLLVQGHWWRRWRKPCICFSTPLLKRWVNHTIVHTTATDFYRWERQHNQLHINQNHGFGLWNSWKIATNVLYKIRLYFLNMNKYEFIPFVTIISTYKLLQLSNCFIFIVFDIQYINVITLLIAISKHIHNIRQKNHNYHFSFNRAALPCDLSRHFPVLESHFCSPSNAHVV